ncbi:MAG: EF-hand domain-containing protein [archaeon]|nr:EF-hand domain-containing protein [archaeon]
MTNKIICTAKRIQTTETENSKRNEPEVPLAPENIYIKQMIKQSDLNTPIGQIQTKVISKKALLEIINDIYKSKETQDRKNSENKLPRETMEQHMYNYLNHKYGLKRLIIEWALGIINSIKLYAKENSEICLFGKILRNELEENLIKIMQKMKTAFEDLIKIYLSEVFPAKDKDSIHSIFLTFKNNQVYLDENIWKYMVAMLYNSNKKDYEILSQKIENFIRNKIEGGIQQENYDTKKRMSKDERMMLEQIKAENKILYKDLFELILAFQIKVRSRYLRNFINIFRSIDSDFNGIININQFREFCRMCQLFSEDDENAEEKIEALVDDIDPNGNNMVTFSEIVEEFEKIELENGYNALDKISMLKREN